MKTKDEIVSRLATIKKRLQALDLHTLTLRVEEVEKLMEEYRSQLTESKELPGDEEMKYWAEIHAIHCYHDGLTSKKHFVEGYLYAVDFFKNNYASPLLASKDARIRKLEDQLKLAHKLLKTH